MVFNIVFSSTYKIDADEIKYLLKSETFNEFFEDIAEVNSSVVKRIVSCDEALKFIVKKLDDDKYKSNYLADDATPENAFNELLTNLIQDNIDGIVYALEKNEKDEPKPKEKFGDYFKSLDTTYGMDRATEDMLYERLKSKDDYKVGDIVCDDSSYDGVCIYSFYKVVKITDKRVKLRQYTCHNNTLSDTILTYIRIDDGTIVSRNIRIHNKLKIADEYSFE